MPVEQVSRFAMATWAEYPRAASLRRIGARHPPSSRSPRARGGACSSITTPRSILGRAMRLDAERGDARRVHRAWRAAAAAAGATLEVCVLTASSPEVSAAPRPRASARGSTTCSRRRCRRSSRPRASTRAARAQGGLGAARDAARRRLDRGRVVLEDDDGAREGARRCAFRSTRAKGSSRRTCG